MSVKTHLAFLLTVMIGTSVMAGASFVALLWVVFG